MAHVAHKMRIGNTNNPQKKSYRKKKVQRQRARTWLFTLNNPTKKLVAQLALKKHPFSGDIIKYLIQEEVGEEGTPHLQGAIQWKSTIEFSTVKSYLPTAHWETSRSVYSSFYYCGKLDTRSGQIFMLGDVEKYVEKEPLSETEQCKKLAIMTLGYEPSWYQYVVKRKHAPDMQVIY